MNNSFFDDDNEKNNLISDINVTPLVDVMLVLLIAFIVTMPILFTQMRFDFPTTGSIKENKDNDNTSIIKITLDKDGNYYLDDKLITTDDLKLYIHDKLSTEYKKDNTVFALNAEIETQYGQLINLIKIIQEEGGIKIGYMEEVK